MEKQTQVTNPDLKQLRFTLLEKALISTPCFRVQDSVVPGQRGGNPDVSGAGARGQVLLLARLL